MCLLPQELCTALGAGARAGNAPEQPQCAGRPTCNEEVVSSLNAMQAPKELQLRPSAQPALQGMLQQRCRACLNTGGRAERPGTE